MNALRLSGCGTQHPHRALGGTCVLLAAAPTTPPCFRHWRRSSSLHFAHIQRKYYFKFWVSEKSADFSETLFHRWGRNGKWQLPRLLPAEAAARWASFLLAEPPQSKPDGFDSSLGEGASGAPANFALEPETVPLCQRPHPRGGCLRSRLGEFFHTHIFCTNCLHSV